MEPTSTLRDPADALTAGAARAEDGAPGLVLGRYRLLRRLGAGGFGSVWLAHDERLGRSVAIKAVPRRDDARGDRAEREALAVARLNHPGIVTLYEAGGDRHSHYLVSELVDGRTLGDAIDRGELSDRDVLRVGLALCAALAHAHAHGVIHRDVKPGNVMLPHDPETAAGVAKLTDFGVARLVGDEPLTRTGDVVGTLAYMAPEQAEGRRVGPAADVYALGLSLYEALAGRHPVRAAGPAATARRLGAVLPSLARTRRDLPAELVTALDRAVRPRPEERGSLAELRAGLAESLPEVSDEGGVIAAPRLPGRAPRGAARLCAGAAAAGLVAAAEAGLGHPPPAPVAVAAAAGVAVALLPRLGWIAVAAAAIGWLLGAGGEAGTAVLLAAALLAVPCLLPRDGRSWSVPALAPVLGLVGAAGAFPALAGQGRSAYRRAALGALGFWWTVMAEALLGRDLLFGRPAGAWPPQAWRPSATDAAAHAVGPALLSGLVAGALVWALAACVLPWLVRGRWLALDALLAGSWAAALVAATGALGGLLGSAVPHPRPIGAATGAALGAVLALIGGTLRGRADPGISP